MMVTLGGILGPFWGLSGYLGSRLGAIGAFGSHLGAILGLSWAPLGVVWIRNSRGIRQFAFKVGYLVLLLSLCRPLLGHLGAILS